MIIYIKKRIYCCALCFAYEDASIWIYSATMKSEAMFAGDRDTQLFPG